MKQTAVEWLLDQIDDMYIHQLYDKEFEQAKEMEKQQIVDAYDDGNYAYGMGIKEPEQYYNETFNTSTPWYDEDKLTERMDIIGQNGNDGEHY
jgi:hypothetical protein